jgi:hypothetical protein
VHTNSVSWHQNKGLKYTRELQDPKYKKKNHYAAYRNTLANIRRWRRDAVHGPVVVSVLQYLYTGCNRRNVRDFGRVFLRSNYTDITQNTYIQTWKFTEILAREKCGLLWCLHTVFRPWCHTHHISLTFNVTIMHFSCIPTLSLTATFQKDQMFTVYSGWKSADNYDTCASVFVVQFNGFMSLTS